MTQILTTNNVVLLMTPDWYKLPEMDIEDDGHFIMLKRMVSGDYAHIITSNGRHSSGMSPSRSAMADRYGHASVGCILRSIMNSYMFVYSRDLTWGSYTGVWVQWKNPRDW